MNLFILNRIVMCANAGVHVTEQQVKSLAVNIFLGYVVESYEAWGKKTINQLKYASFVAQYQFRVP